MARIRNALTKFGRLLDRQWCSRLLLLLAIGLFLTLTLTRLTDASIWFDEAYSAYLTRYNLADLTHYTAIDVHPPLYYLLLKGWSSLFGSSVAVYRSLSVVLGVAALLVIYCLIRQLLNRRTASVATLLVAVSPMFVRYGTETRMYMLVVLIAVAATLVFNKMLHSTQRRWAVLYGVLICMGMWTHYFTAVIWLSHWLYRFIYLRRHGLHGKGLFRGFFDSNWLIAHGLAIVGYLPWVPVALRQMSGLSGGFWIPAITANTLTDYITKFLMYRGGSDVSGWLVVAMLIIVAMAVYLGVKVFKHSSGRERDGLQLILTIAAAPVVILFLLSMPPFTPMFIDRYLLTALVFLAILLGAIIAISRRQLPRVVVLTVLLMGSFGYGIYNVYHQGTYGEFSSGGLAQDLMTDIQADDESDVPIVVADNYSYYEMAIYENDDNPVHFLLEPIRNDNTGSLQMERDNKFGVGVDNLSDYVADNGKIWIVNAISERGEAKLPDNVDNLVAVKTLTATNPIHNSTYSATLYQVGDQ